MEAHLGVEYLVVKVDSDGARWLVATFKHAGNANIAKAALNRSEEVKCKEVSPS